LAAWIATWSDPIHGTGSLLDVLTLPNGEATLDHDQSPDALSDLQLFQCAVGCAPNTTVVTWTHSGTQRYTELAG
jgi:hypothetical protein